MSAELAFPDTAGDPRRKDSRLYLRERITDLSRRSERLAQSLDDATRLATAETVRADAAARNMRLEEKRRCATGPTASRP